MGERSFGASLLCPRCHGPTTVVDTRLSHQFGRSIRRRRSCNKCANKFSTHEFPEDVAERINSTEEFTKKLKQMRYLIDEVIRATARSS